MLFRKIWVDCSFSRSEFVLTRTHIHIWHKYECQQYACLESFVNFNGLFSTLQSSIYWTYLERNREKQMKTWHLQNIFDRAAAVRKLLFENGLQSYKLILLSLWVMQSMNISFLQGLVFIGSLLSYCRLCIICPH